jgi:hypothetical protein
MYILAKKYNGLSNIVVLKYRCVNMICWEDLFWLPSFSVIGIKKIKNIFSCRKKL